MNPKAYRLQLIHAIANKHQQVIQHPLFDQITHPQHLNCFMEHHVFAVWDFMCLLKTLYAQIACTTVPWYPAAHAQNVHWISRIMQEEEADCFFPEAETPQYTSHLEAYLLAMQDCGASTRAITDFLTALRPGYPFRPHCPAFP